MGNELGINLASSFCYPTCLQNLPCHLYYNAIGKRCNSNFMHFIGSSMFLVIILNGISFNNVIHHDVFLELKSEKSVPLKITARETAYCQIIVLNEFMTNTRFHLVTYSNDLRRHIRPLSNECDHCYFFYNKKDTTTLSCNVNSFEKVVVKKRKKNESNKQISRHSRGKRERKVNTA